MRGRRVAAVASAALLGLGCAALGAQDISPAPASARAAKAASTAVPVVSGSPADYHPSMGDMMTMAIQPRHTKLGLAGEQHNWAYAAYELNELRNAFGRASRAVPIYQNMDTATLMAGYVKAPLDALERAIKAGNGREFHRDYRELTETCNACHASLHHEAVVIQEPAGNDFPDQNFAPHGGPRH